MMHVAPSCTGHNEAITLFAPAIRKAAGNPINSLAGCCLGSPVQHADKTVRKQLGSCTSASTSPTVSNSSPNLLSDPNGRSLILVGKERGGSITIPARYGFLSL